MKFTSQTDAEIFQRKEDNRYIWRGHISPIQGFSAPFLRFEDCVADAKTSISNHLKSLNRHGVQVVSVYCGRR